MPGNFWGGARVVYCSVPPEGRDMARATQRWLKYLIAILLGNGLYFVLSPQLPPAARHATDGFNLGTLVDLWFCVAVYGLMELGAFLSHRRPK
jgi:hypothetical protein